MKFFAKQRGYELGDLDEHFADTGVYLYFDKWWFRLAEKLLGSRPHMKRYFHDYVAAR